MKLILLLRNLPKLVFSLYYTKNFPNTTDDRKNNKFGEITIFGEMTIY